MFIYLFNLCGTLNGVVTVLQAMNYGSKAIFLATGKKKYLAASVLRYKSAQVNMHTFACK